jgi:VanZ family protein
MALIFIGSHQSRLVVSENTLLDLLLKKGGHVVEYAVLGLLLQRAIIWRGAITATRALIALMVGIAYAISDEAHQSLVPGRSPRLLDVGIDTLAQAVVLAATYLRGLVLGR